MGIQPEGERKNDTGESVFPATDLITLFSGLLIYLLLHIETKFIQSLSHVRLFVTPWTKAYCQGPAPVDPG